MSKKRTTVFNEILLDALDILNISSESDGATAYQLEKARRAFSNLLDRLERKGIRIFRREWRTRTFQSSSLVLVNSETYECIKSHSSVNATTWTISTAYTADDIVYPSTYDGMYYVAQNNGTSAGTQPTFNPIQNSLTLDNNIYWKALPDNKPGVGKDWLSYWRKRKTDGIVWVNNTSYYATGSFDLLDDEIEITNATVFYAENKPMQVNLINTDEYAIDPCISETGYPTDLYVKTDGLYMKTCQLSPAPDLTGVDGYILKYYVNKRGLDAEEGTIDVDFPDHWFETLTYMLASSLCLTFQIDFEYAQRVDRKAEVLYNEMKRSDRQTVRPERVTPCW